jgi:hypothetical protein
MIVLQARCCDAAEGAHRPCRGRRCGSQYWEIGHSGRARLTDTRQTNDQGRLARAAPVLLSGVTSGCCRRCSELDRHRCRPLSRLGPAPLSSSRMCRSMSSQKYRVQDRRLRPQLHLRTRDPRRRSVKEPACVPCSPPFGKTRAAWYWEALHRPGLGGSASWLQDVSPEGLMASDCGKIGPPDDGLFICDLNSLLCGPDPVGSSRIFTTASVVLPSNWRELRRFGLSACRAKLSLNDRLFARASFVAVAFTLATALHVCLRL